MELSQSLQNRAGAQAAGAAEISRPERNALHAPVDEGPMAAADRPAGVSHLLGAVLQGTESMIRATPGLSIVAAALVALTPVHAFAQGAGDNARVNVRERSRPEYDPLGLRFGSLRLDASLGLSAESTDNLRAAEVGQIDDVIYRVTPDVRLGSTWSRHALSVSAGATSVSHQDTTSEDYDTYYIGANGRIDLGSRTQISADARMAHMVEPRGDVNGTFAGAPVEYDQQRVSIGVAHTFNRVRVSGRFAVREDDFDGDSSLGLQDPDLRDLSEDSFTGRVEFAVSPRLAVVGQLIEDKRDYDNDPGLTNNGERYTAGLGVNISNLLRGEILVGQFRRDYDIGRVDEGTQVDGNLAWYVSGITTVSGVVSRTADASVGLGASEPYVVDRFGVQVDHELLRNLILSAAYNLSDLDYTTSDRQDEDTAYWAEAEYLLNRRVALQARASYRDVTSTGANRYRDFEETRFLAGLSLRL